MFPVQGMNKDAEPQREKQGMRDGSGRSWDRGSWQRCRKPRCQAEECRLDGGQ